MPPVVTDRDGAFSIGDTPFDDALTVAAGESLFTGFGGWNASSDGDYGPSSEWNGGETMTQVVRRPVSAQDRECALFGILAPTAASDNVTVDTVDNVERTIVSISATNIGSLTPEDTAQADGSTANPSLAFSGVTVGSLLVMVVQWYNRTPTGVADDGDGYDWQNQGGGNDSVAIVYGLATSTTPTITLNLPAGDWAAVGAAFPEASSGADGYGVIRAHPRALGHGQKGGEGSSRASGSPTALALGEKGGDGFGLARAAGAIQSLGEKSADGQAFAHGAPRALGLGEKASEGFGLAFGVPRSSAQGEKAGEGSVTGIDIGRMLAHGEKLGEGFALNSDLAYALGHGEKDGTTDGYGFVFSPSRMLAEGSKGGEASALARELGRMLGLGEKAGDGFGLARGVPYGLALGEKAGSGWGAAIDIPYVLGYAVKEGASLSEGYAFVFNTGRVLAEGSKAAEAFGVMFDPAWVLGYATGPNVQVALVAPHVADAAERRTVVDGGALQGMADSLERDKEKDIPLTVRLGHRLPEGVTLSNPTAVAQTKTADNPPTYVSNDDISIVSVIVVDDTVRNRPSQAIQFVIEADPDTQPDITDPPIPGDNYRVVVTADRSDVGGIVGKAGLRIMP